MSTKNFFYFHRFTFTSTTLPVFNSKSTTFISVSLAFIFNFQYFIRFSFIVNLFLFPMEFVTVNDLQKSFISFNFRYFTSFYFFVNFILEIKKLEEFFSFFELVKFPKYHFPNSFSSSCLFITITKP